MRSNLKLIVLSLIALAGLIGFLVVLSTRTTCAIGLGVLSYTNCSAIVSFTNLSYSQLDYILKVERKTEGGWPKYEAGIPLGIDSGKSGSLYPGEVSTLTVPVMVYAPPCPWRASIFYHKPAVRLNSVRFKTFIWLTRLRLPPKWAQKVIEVEKPMQVSSPQMEQWEK